MSANAMGATLESWPQELGCGQNDLAAKLKASIRWRPGVADGGGVGRRGCGQEKGQHGGQ